MIKEQDFHEGAEIYCEVGTYARACAVGTMQFS